MLAFALASVEASVGNSRYKWGIAVTIGESAWGGRVSEGIVLTTICYCHKPIVPMIPELILVCNGDALVCWCAGVHTCMEALR